MATNKLSEVSVIASMNSNDYITVILEDGTIGKIKKSDLYPVGDSLNNGLMPRSMINSLTGARVFPVGYSGDLNELHNEVEHGLSTFSCVTATTNAPGNTGILLHVQRASKGVTTTSQIITQYFTAVNGLYIRSGRGTGSVINWDEWKKF